jgi:adenosylcobinamide-GDP ribazoletransferase
MGDGGFGGFCRGYPDRTRSRTGLPVSRSHESDPPEVGGTGARGEVAGRWPSSEGVRMKRLIGAVRFLTILPVRGSGASPGESALFFPLLGAAIAVAGVPLFRFFDYFLGPALASLLVVGFWSWLSGGLHENGLANVAGAFRRDRSPSQIVEDLKDGRIGAYGAVALIFVIAIRWQALQRMPSEPVRELAACFALSRAAMVGVAWLTRPFGDGWGARFSAALTTPGALIAIATGAAFAWMANPQLGPVLIAVAVLVSWMLREWFDARIGGVNGDCLAATCLISETVLMGVASCRNCFW